MTYIYGWEITKGDLAGEEFFTELESEDREVHRAYVKTIFPNERFRCFGQYTEEEAECLGLDTY